MKKVIVVVGQTATGKTLLALRLAKKFNGEIISADSRQVYKGLDIGTDKIKKKDMRGVPHHLLDVAQPKYKFTVSDFQKLTISAIADMCKRQKIPIICGGTGFYIDSITKGIVFPQVPPNKKLRAATSKLDGRQLLMMLKKLDKARAKSIDPKNRVRIIRAIEIAKALGRVPKIKTQKQKYKFIKIGLKLNDETLKKRIIKRAKKQLDSGLKKEIAKLKRMRVSQKRLKEFGFEYDHPTLESLVKGTWAYAKRQKTWWKRDREIKWFSPEEYSKIETYIKKNL